MGLCWNVYPVQPRAWVNSFLFVSYAFLSSDIFISLFNNLVQNKKVTWRAFKTDSCFSTVFLSSQLVSFGLGPGICFPENTCTVLFVVDVLSPSIQLGTLPPSGKLAAILTCTCKLGVEI